MSNDDPRCSCGATASFRVAWVNPEHPAQPEQVELSCWDHVGYDTFEAAIAGARRVVVERWPLEVGGR